MSDSSVRDIPSPPPRRKKYHRRGPWACDECRLRKRKCDGLRPCNPCVSTSMACTYDSRSLIQPPTQKIRSLEDKLRLARAALQQLKAQGIDTGCVDLDSTIQTLQCGSIAVPGVSPPESPTSDGRKVDNMMGGCGHLVTRPQKSEAFFGASSGFSFVCRTLELFLKVSETLPSTTNIHSAMLDLFDRPLPEKLRLQNLPTSPQDLPPRATTLRILDSLFARCSFVAQFLQRSEIRQIVDRIYQPVPLHLELHGERTLMLIHSLLALGYLYHVSLHRTQGCRAVVDEALQHFTKARRALDITQCNDSMSLQGLLCIIIFLISTSRIVPAHPYIAVACSSAMRLGLHSPSLESLSLSHEQRQLRRSTLITILKLDVYSSLILGLPPFVELRSLDKHLALSEHNLMSRHVDVGRVLHDDAVRLELSLKHLELLKITASGLDAAFPQLAPPTTAGSGESLLPVNIQQLEEVGSQFQQWAESFSAILGHTTDSPSIEMFKYELEITYYFGQIVLYQPFLHYLKRMADGKALSRSQSQQALACIKISSITITRSEEMMKRGLICSASWMSVYSIFMAVISLVFLIAAHNGTSMPSEAWRKAQSGIRLLAAARCRDDGATACLGVLKKLIAELSHTVDFDIEQIESSTARLCQHSLTHDDSADEDGGAIFPNEQWTPLSGNAQNLLAARTSSTVLRPSPLWREFSIGQMSGDSDGLESVAFPCDADEILAEAQGISLGHGMDYFMNNDDYTP